MATKKATATDTKKVYVVFDGDGDHVVTGTLKEITSDLSDSWEDDELEEFTIAEVGPRKKFTLTPATIKVG